MEAAPVAAEAAELARPAALETRPAVKIVSNCYIEQKVRHLPPEAEMEARAAGSVTVES